MNDKSLSIELLNSVQLLIQGTKGQELTTQLVESLKDAATPLAVFFNIDTLQAIVLSIHLDYAIKDNEITTERMINHFGKKISAIPEINEAADHLINRNLLFVSQQGRSSKIKLDYKRVLRVPDKVLNTIMKGNIDLMGNKKATSFLGILEEMEDLVSKRTQREITTEVLVEEIMGLLLSNKEFQEVSWLLSIDGITKYDLAILLNITIQQLNGNEEVDLDNIIKEVYSDLHDRISYKRAVKENQCVLLNKQIIEESEFSFSFCNLVKLSDPTIDILIGGFKEIVQKVFKPQMGTIIYPEKIGDERLFYNSKEKEQLLTLSNSLKQEMYGKLIANLSSNGMKPSISVLFYGDPGTGKTSSVKQIAKATGRPIYFVEIEKIQSKWVGDSEKNLAKVFREYEEARKHFGQDPILLFNEADAILGKRFTVHSSTDKSYNTLQNILLQELEDFEGIFMATTNLANQLDSAFDRRFLYKINFKNPELEVRKQILQNVFADLPEQTVDRLNQQYSLTGGQISNIKKKIFVNKLLNQQEQIEEQLMSICEEEVALAKSVGRNPIGFFA